KRRSRRNSSSRSRPRPFRSASIARVATSALIRPSRSRCRRRSSTAARARMRRWSRSRAANGPSPVASTRSTRRRATRISAIPRASRPTRSTSWCTRRAIRSSWDSASPRRATSCRSLDARLPPRIHCLSTMAGAAEPRWAIGFGSSQAGRFLKDLVYQGFNLDERKRIVFDGLIPHISGSRRIFVNAEFAMPGRFPTALEGHYFPGDEFPYTYENAPNPSTRKTDGVLARCRVQQACPKIMHWDSGTEAYQARNSLVVTDPRGRSEAPIPSNVRLYYFSGTQHGPAEKPARDTCQQLSNPLSYQETQRALLVALQDWVTKGIEPPDSRFPRLSDGTLVDTAREK